MSRIGKLPVTVPAGVEIIVDEGNLVTVKGPKGTLCEQLSNKIDINIEDDTIRFTPVDEDRKTNAQHGLARTLVNNMVHGVSQGYEKKLIIAGVGYRAEKKGQDLVLQLGYSHPVIMTDPEGITTEVPDATTVLVKGADKALVGNHAANIRKWRKPEPYNGKGIRYDYERIRRKEGKTGK